MNPYNTNSIHWPTPKGFLSRVRNITSIGRKWENLTFSDFINLMSACMHDYSFESNTIIIEIMFSKRFQKIISLEIISHNKLFTCIDSYNFDELSKLIINNLINKIRLRINYQIACQSYGALWLV